MRTIIEDMFKMKNWAVLGATPTTSKFGYKIFKKLVNCSFSVTPVNPRYDSIDGIACIANLKDQGQIEVVNVVVAPELAYNALTDIADSGIKYVWFQPGAYDQSVLDRAAELGLNSVYGYCVLVELGELAYCPL